MSILVCPTQVSTTSLSSSLPSRGLAPDVSTYPTLPCSHKSLSAYQGRVIKANICDGVMEF